MIRKNLVHENGMETTVKEIGVFPRADEMRVLSNPVAWKIVELLSKRPLYPSQIAKELKIYEQSAYYYIRKLLSIGAISHVQTSMVGGGTAKFYRTSCPAFGIEMEGGEKRIEGTTKKTKPDKGQLFFDDFINDGWFNGIIVVGAPDPHGPYRSSSRDGHYAIHLAFLLGTYCGIPRNFPVKLDADAKAEKVTTIENIITIGGPGTNIITAEFNRYLPIHFNQNNFWSGLVNPSGKNYNLDNHGLLAKIRNPFNNKISVVVLAGVRSVGTKSSIIALTNHADFILKNYKKDENWAMVVQGFDMDSDGKIDNVDIIDEVSSS
jgi:S-layer like family, C-terminal region